MSAEEGLYLWVQEVLEPLGTVTMRKMMGVTTLYLDGVVFAIMDEDELWFKADNQSDAAWDAQGCERFTVTFEDGRVGTMNYRRAPSDVYDDPEEMQHWARLAQEAGSAAPPRRGRGGRRLSGRSAPQRRDRTG